MTQTELIGIWQEPYTSGAINVGGHVYRQGTPQGLQDFLNETFTSIGRTFATAPPDAGTSCLTLLAWVSGGVTQDPVQVCQDRGETDIDFINRAKRIFKDALTDNPPD